MDDRELMDKIRKSMEDTPVPDSLKQEMYRKCSESRAKINSQMKQPGRRKKISQKAPPHTDSGMPELPDISVQQRQSL